MRFYFIFSCIFLLTIFHQAWCADTSIKKKYPYELLTEDYDVLNEKDLAFYTLGIKYKPFSLKSSGYNYWQCFSREHVSITLQDMGYSTKDFDWQDTLSELKITVWIKPGVLHEYVMRRVWPVAIYQKQFNLYRKLMKGEKYVCLAGHFVDLQEEVRDKEKWKVYSWIFEELKTKKGCDSYLHGNCNDIYKKYKQEKAAISS